MITFEAEECHLRSTPRLPSPKHIPTLAEGDGGAAKTDGGMGKCEVKAVVFELRAGPGISLSI